MSRFTSLGAAARAAFVILLLTATAACSGSRDPIDDRGPRLPDPDPTPAVDLSRYEDFDVGAYPDEVPAREAVSHDVPASLLDGEAEVTGPRTVQGYRIQIFSSRDKATADRYLDDAMGWWRSRDRDGTLDDVYGEETSPEPVYLVYRQPYYRIRMGNFESRRDAAGLLRLVKARFPDAFIVPDRVSLTR